MKDGVGLDPAYFFDDYEGQRPAELYLLDRKRDEARAAELAKQLSQLSSKMTTMEQELAEMRLERGRATPLHTKAPRAKF